MIPAEQLPLSRLADDIRRRGHWQIVVQPLPLAGERVRYRELEPTLASARVQLRGWDFPHFDRTGSLQQRTQSILQETDWRYYRETWEFWQTGLFTYLIGIHEDWTERAPGWGPPPHLTRRGALLGIGDTIARMTEVFLFAGRLAASRVGADVMHLAIEISQLNGRSLWMDSPRRRDLDGVFTSAVDTFLYDDHLESGALQAHGLSLAVDRSLDVFARFGWHPPRSVVEAQQSELGKAFLDR